MPDMADSYRESCCWLYEKCTRKRVNHTIYSKSHDLDIPVGSEAIRRNQGKRLPLFHLKTIEKSKEKSRKTLKNKDFRLKTITERIISVPLRWSKWQDLNLRPLPPQNKSRFNSKDNLLKNIKNRVFLCAKWVIFEATGMWCKILNNNFLDKF